MADFGKATPSASAADVALLGTGPMGASIARRLIGAGHRVTVWNRTAAKARSLVAAGALWATSPVDAARGAEVLITMLADGDVVTDVLFTQGTVGAMVPGSLLIDMSSIAPATAREHARRAAERGIGYLDAPVSGGVVGAAEGTLAILVGGEASDVARAREVLSALGRPTHIGPAGAGQVAKLANQVICGITIGGVAEGLRLAAAGGADPQVVREALFGGFADSRVLREHGARMVARDFEPGGTVRNHLKDIRAALDVARETHVELPLAEAFRRLLVGVAEHEGPDVDHSAVLLELERRSAP